MTTSRVIRREGVAAIVEQTGEARVLMISFPLNVTVSSAEYPPNSIRIHALTGNLRQLEGGYEISAGGDGKSSCAGAEKSNPTACCRQFLRDRSCAQSSKRSFAAWCPKSSAGLLPQTNSGGKMTFNGLALRTLLAVLPLGGCATFDLSREPQPVAVERSASQCGEWIASVDKAVADAGVVDAGAYRVPGFPYLRMDRFVASFAPQASRDDALFEAWARSARALDREGRSIELRNLPGRGPGEVRRWDAGARSGRGRKRARASS